MQTFEKNIFSIYGKKGGNWIANLPERVCHFKKLWHLNRLKPVKNLSLNYVLTGFQQKNPIILKLSPDPKTLSYEADALKAFANHGAVSILDKAKDALLLQKASPGKSLKTYFPKKSDKAIKIGCEVISKLHKAPLKNKKFPHITEWLATLDKDWNIPKTHLHRARILKNQLLKKSYDEVLLHGDLHQDNILSDGDDWVVIDPKGVIGFPINEVWAVVEQPEKDLIYISQYFDFNLQDVFKWYYVHLVLATCWCAEDNLDLEPFLGLAESCQYRI